MSMGDDNQSADRRSNSGLVRRIARTFLPYRAKVTFVGLLILVTAGLGVVNPVLIRVVFDSALFPPDGGPDLNLLWLIADVLNGFMAIPNLIGLAVLSPVIFKITREYFAQPEIAEALDYEEAK